MSFPPVGHTHEDIDQLFSKISMALRRQVAESISGVYFIKLHMLRYINGYQLTDLECTIASITDFTFWLL